MYIQNTRFLRKGSVWLLYLALWMYLIALFWRLIVLWSADLFALPHARIPYDKYGWIKVLYRMCRHSLGSVFFNWPIANSTLEIFRLIYFKCSVHAKCSSIWIPKNLVDFSAQVPLIWSMTHPFILSTLSFTSALNWGGLKIINLVLVAFKKRSFTQNQLNNLERIKFIFSNNKWPVQ